MVKPFVFNTFVGTVTGTVACYKAGAFVNGEYIADKKIQHNYCYDKDGFLTSANNFSRGLYQVQRSLPTIFAAAILASSWTCLAIKAHVISYPIQTAIVLGITLVHGLRQGDRLISV